MDEEQVVNEDVLKHDSIAPTQTETAAPGP